MALGILASGLWIGFALGFAAGAALGVLVTLAIV